jgi:hypothetical protein
MKSLAPAEDGGLVAASYRFCCVHLVYDALSRSEGSDLCEEFVLLWRNW